MIQEVICLLTIGEFSQLSRVSPRMLRHYDSIGLLHPAHTRQDNGYRCYDESQLADVVRIRQLSRYGFPLSEIGALLALPEAELALRLHERRMAVYGELSRLRKTLRQMEEQIMQMEGIDMSEKYSVILLEDPVQKVFSIRRTIDITQIHDLFADLHREAAARGLHQRGCTQLLYHSQEGETFSHERIDGEAQVVVDGDGPDIIQRPVQLCAATTHKGPYERLQYAYDALCAWMGQHPEYQICGPAIERYLKDEREVSGPEELETGVMFPVKRR